MVHRIEKRGENDLLFTLKDGEGNETTINCSQVMFATGRKPNIEGLGLQVGPAAPASLS